MTGTEGERSGEVRIWSDSVDKPGQYSELFEMLSDDERARAGRFRFERDRVRFVARRAFRRKVLASYIGTAPAAVQLRTSAQGRPELDAPSELSFNASHSDGLAVVAVTYGRVVGVDVERIRPIGDALELARGSFSREEEDVLRATPASSRSQTFLAMWTRKESFAKAVGAGLSMPFDGFDIPDPGDGRTGRPRSGGREWPYVVASLEGLAGWVGAVTLSGTRAIRPIVTDLATS
jgi:4'-phosphopantetheinyl transferase